MVLGQSLSRGYIQAVSLCFRHLELEDPLPRSLTWCLVGLNASWAVGGDLSSLPHGFPMGCLSILRTWKLASPRLNGQKDREELKTEAASLLYPKLRSDTTSLLPHAVGQADQPLYNEEGDYTWCE